MNTEINLLEKEQKKYSASLICGIVFLLLLALAIGLLLFQKNIYENRIEAEENQLSQVKILLSDHQNEFTNRQQFQQLQQDIGTIQAGSVPHVKLYNRLLGYLSSPDKLISYEFTNENQLIFNAEFASLKDVANYVTELLELNYIQGTQLTSVNNNGTSFQATLTVRFDSGMLKKELGNND
ncbi:hypothetical protein [Virgibacillus doumboii]|uniref:hypothetical protein n=1 Tax=Virgibacillus doumboii TaxID=2697503 RepID=UPI0013E08D3A|nr:hypothetical protein [Virgibacillus doumboii]